MNCQFCSRKVTKKHLCSKMFCYEHIFKQIFINIVLDFKPDKDDFYNVCIKRIDRYKMFNYIPNPYPILKECMEIFIKDYTW